MRRWRVAWERLLVLGLVWSGRDAVFSGRRGPSGASGFDRGGCRAAFWARRLSGWCW